MVDAIQENWKTWALGAMSGLIMFMLGAFGWDRVLAYELKAHALAPGHPVIVERVDRLAENHSKDYKTIEARLARIEDKIDILIGE